jgi:hypothetical protein
MTNILQFCITMVVGFNPNCKDKSFFFKKEREREKRGRMIKNKLFDRYLI